MEKTCCFTGHRDIPEGIKENLKNDLQKELITLIEDGYTTFAAGGALGFDTIAAKTVIELKKEYDIKLLLILPCMNQAKNWRAESAYEYELIKFHADEIRYTQELYSRGCFLKRDRALVDASSACIAYLTKETGGTAYTCEYAQKRGIRVINLAETARQDYFY